MLLTNVLVVSYATATEQVDDTDAEHLRVDAEVFVALQSRQHRVRDASIPKQKSIYKILYLSAVRRSLLDIFEVI